MEINYLHCMWVIYSFIVTFSGLNVLFVKGIPQILIRLFAFGKAHKGLDNKNSLTSLLEIPKSWFSHFYVFAVIYFLYITKAVICTYFHGFPSSTFVEILNIFASPRRYPKVSAESVVILCILLLLQVLRRCYECFYVSVYSESKMNVAHYIVGYTFYFGVGLSLLHEAPGFQATYDAVPNYITGKWFTLNHYIGVLLFLFGFILQYKSHKSLASLRKTDKKVTSMAHHIPTGWCFEWVSCPHYFSEILMYLAGCVILSGKSFTWWLVCLWTVCNQLITGLMSHLWYKKTFKNYPIKRKAVLKTKQNI